MKKPTRIAIEVLLPALIAAVGTSAYHAIADFGRFSVTNIPLLAGVVFAVSLIPSFVYMVVVEIARSLGLRGQKSAVLFSWCVGAVIGLGFLASVGHSEIWTRSMADYLFVAFLGGGSGAFIALAISKKEEPNKTAQTTPGLRPSVSDL
jgi:hypothetical protein